MLSSLGPPAGSLLASNPQAPACCNLNHSPEPVVGSPAPRLLSLSTFEALWKPASLRRWELFENGCDRMTAEPSGSQGAQTLTMVWDSTGNPWVCKSLGKHSKVRHQSAVTGISSLRMCWQKALFEGLGLLSQLWPLIYRNEREETWGVYIKILFHNNVSNVLCCILIFTAKSIPMISLILIVM